MYQMHAIAASAEPVLVFTIKVRFHQNRVLHNCCALFVQNFVSARTNRTPLVNRVPTGQKFATFVREQCGTCAELCAYKSSVQCALTLQ